MWRVVAKISAIPHHRDKEYDIVRYLRHAASKEPQRIDHTNYLPLFFSHHTVKFDSTTPQARIFLWALKANIPYEMRHLEILVQDLRYPITQMYDLYEMVAAYRDIYQVIRWLETYNVWHGTSVSPIANFDWCLVFLVIST